MDQFVVRVEVTAPTKAMEAMAACLRTMAENPMQDYGEENLVVVRAGNSTYEVVRNQLSYTVREMGL